MGRKPQCVPGWQQQGLPLKGDIRAVCRGHRIDSAFIVRLWRGLYTCVCLRRKCRRRLPDIRTGVRNSAALTMELLVVFFTQQRR
jgi:hypothetical protein